MRVLKICPSDWVGGNRDRRELSVCQELGAETLVISKGNPEEKIKKETQNGFNIIYLSTRPLGLRVPSLLNRIASIFSWVHYASSVQADIISGHDLTGLFIGYLSNALKPKEKKAQLVYDSHEFEIYRSGKRNKLTRHAVVWLERFLMKQCAFSIMVNDSIADEVQKIHKLNKRPIVVRNVSSLWERNEAACARIRHEFCQALGMPDDTFLVMYHGGILPNRGIENMMAALALLKDVAGIILGYGDQNYVATLKKLARDLGIENRIMFHEAVPHNILMNYVGAVDCGLVTVLNSCTSYYYMLPNKFFENIQSETPVIGSDFPEISRLILKYDIGLLCDPSKPEEIAQLIAKMRDDRALYARYKANLKLAKKELCWEREKEILKKEYLACMSRKPS